MSRDRYFLLKIGDRVQDFPLKLGSKVSRDRYFLLKIGARVQDFPLKLGKN